MKICIVTTNRADYGLLRPVLREIAKQENLSAELVVTGAHLLQSAGMTISEIQHDNFPIAAEIPMFAEPSGTDSHAEAVSEGLRKFDAYFRKTKPDCVMVLGDRFELFSIVLPAFLAGIPIVHLCGGDMTLGAIDESIRHAVTKLSTLHFVTNAESERHVLQLGEQPDRVFNVGHTAIDNLNDMTLMNRADLSRELSVSFKALNILMTFHPETYADDRGVKALRNTLSVLGDLQDTGIFITGSNNDPGFEDFRTEVARFVKANSNASFFSSLGTYKYFSLMAQVDVVVGNSSSGLMEVPYFKIPTIDIGNRQQGRLRGNSIIHSDGSPESLRRALDEALNFNRDVIKNPYGEGGAAEKIAAIMNGFAETGIATKKEWFIPKALRPE